ncbi:hypothetical protein L873DRAFT_1814991 [Choiromyces venosus 120613-1]|uniref:Uncharacterized protein n=1 Tax=Choiromyces venosus 120613-1 TaxID=1336337 RepID=A0A3N4JBL9_9PEZI|nr:hypothetical protein L873DRAFT_1814991 [Choiromyces venosus 120613-1]
MKLCVLHMWSSFKPGNLESFYPTYETASRVQEQSWDFFIKIPSYPPSMVPSSMLRPHRS